MFQFGVLALTFGLIFLAELPDKSAIATLILGTRFPWRWIFVGVSAAFAVHMAIAVFAGSLLTLLPGRVVEGVVALLFLLGAFLVWREGLEKRDDENVDTSSVPTSAGFLRVAGLGFGTIFVGEWGDLTQILAANLAAQHHAPWEVGIGATLALMAVALVALLGGRTLLKYLPIKWITRVAAAIMLVLGAISAVAAIRG
jgi:putative Ca2+/H+ antiporter (TMEM165/GDT1 family)